MYAHSPEHWKQLHPLCSLSDYKACGGHDSGVVVVAVMMVFAGMVVMAIMGFKSRI
jgi:hypothetical protein